MASNWSQKRTCKDCVFDDSPSGCRFKVKQEKVLLAASKPLEPCMKITSDRDESKFYNAGMDKVFEANLSIHRA